jgi:hypothetical protein
MRGTVLAFAGEGLGKTTENLSQDVGILAEI